MGAIHDAIQADPDNAALIKAQAWADRNLPAGWAVVYRTHTITLTGAIDASTGHARLTMTVVRGDGTDITPPDLNPITFTSPPYLVADPAGDVVIETTDPEGNVTTINAREDVLTRIVHALQDIADRIIDGD